MTRIFFICLFLLTFLAGCSEKNHSGSNLESLETWHNRFHRNRYHADSSLILADQLAKESEHAPVEYLALVQMGYGHHHNYHAHYQLSRLHFSQAAGLLQETKNDTLLARAYSGIGNAYKNLGKYSEAIDTLLLSARLFEKANHNEGIAGSHLSLAQVYQQKDDLPRIKEQLTIVMQRVHNDRGNVYHLLALHTLANFYGMSGKIDSAMLIDRIGIRLADSVNNTHFKTPFLDNLANCHKEMGLFDSSRIYFMECLLLDSLNDDRKQMADTYLNLADLGTAEGNFAQAERDGKRAIELSKITGYLPGQRSAWLVLNKLYISAGQFEEALEAKDSAFAIREKMINEKKESRIAELETIYETEKKEEQIITQEKQLLQQRIIIGAGIILLLTLVLLGVSYYRNYNEKKKNELQNALHKEQEKSTVAIFESEQNERMRIARDLHDSVGQMLSVVKMQLSTQQAPGETIQLIDSTINEVRAISHNLIPEELNFGLLRALEELGDKINSAGNVKLELLVAEEIQPGNFSKSFSLSVYRIIQEIVNNMLRHANASLITIQLRNENEIVLLDISDNGKGFDQTIISESKGIGWKNVIARVKLLGGKMIISSDNKGTLIALTLPQ